MMTNCMTQKRKVHFVKDFNVEVSMFIEII